VTRGSFVWVEKREAPPVRLGLLSSEPRTGGTTCSLRKPGWNCTCSTAMAGRSPPSQGSSGSTGGRRSGTRPRPSRHGTGRGPGPPSRRPPPSPTSSAAWRPAQTCGRPSSCASCGRDTGTEARTPACAAGWSSSGRPRRPSPPCASRRAPGSRPRATGPRSGPGRSVTGPPTSSPSWPSSAARGWSPSGLRPTRPGRRPWAGSSAASTTSAGRRRSS